MAPRFGIPSLELGNLAHLLNSGKQETKQHYLLLNELHFIYCNNCLGSIDIQIYSHDKPRTLTKQLVAKKRQNL